MASPRTFLWTVVVFAVAIALCCWNRAWVSNIWIGVMVDSAPAGPIVPFWRAPADVAEFQQRCAVLTASLLAFPVFCAEAWLLLCRVTGREHARRLTLPFSAASTANLLLVLWLARLVWPAIAPAPL